MTRKLKGDGYLETVFTVPIYHDVIHVVVAKNINEYCRKYGEAREHEILGGVDCTGHH